MTDTELSEIKVRSECTLVCSAKDIPALLPLVYEQQVEIEHLKRALDWACQHGEKLCTRFAAIAQNGCFDCPIMSDRNSIKSAPICKGWKSSALEATKEATDE